MQYSKPALFKDYNKSTSDLLTKSYNEAGLWKMESKAKCGADSFILNPQATSDGKISVDVEYAANCGGSVKVNLAPNTPENMKFTGTFNYNGHKFDGSVIKKGKDYDFEVAHETCVLLNKRASINEKITKQAIELGLGLDVAPNCQVGAGAVYDMKDKKCDWNFACRYASAGREVAIRSNRCKIFITSASAPVYIPLPSGKRHTVIIAGETTCGRDQKYNGVFGAETLCPMCEKNALKVRMSCDKTWALAYIMKVSQCWTMAVSINQDKKPGVLITHN